MIAGIISHPLAFVAYWIFVALPSGFYIYEHLGTQRTNSSERRKFSLAIVGLCLGIFWFMIIFSMYPGSSYRYP